MTPPPNSPPAADSDTTATDPNTAPKVLGIDLGTTNSVMTAYLGTQPEVLINSDGDRITPSVVAFSPDDTDDTPPAHTDDSPSTTALDATADADPDTAPDPDAPTTAGSDAAISAAGTPDGTWLVGKPAINQEVQNPEGTIRSVKRRMGDRDPVTLHDTTFEPEEISAQILRKLKRDAETYLDDRVTQAVITVPAYFNDRQRKATRAAAEIAGLEPVGILNEPSAAAKAYGHQLKQEQDLDRLDDHTVLVFDLGGGTFDVTIVEIDHDIYEVAAINGDDQLGGDDWDSRLATELADRFEADHGINPLEASAQARTRLRAAARDAKETLSNAPETTVSLPFLVSSNDHGTLSLEETLTRAEFEDLTNDLTQQLVEPTEQVLADADVDPHDIDDVILVGGATRMPQIRDHVEELLGQAPKHSINPDEAVAIGAGYEAGTVGGDVTGVALLDSLSLSLGVKIRNGLFERVIPKNTTLPAERTRTFTTAAANQTSVNIEVFQGERELAEENVKLGQFILRDIPPAPAGTPQIDVTFSVDEDGTVEITATETASGVRADYTLDQQDVGLDRDAIQQLKSDAESYAEKDAERRQQIELRNDAEKTVQVAETVLHEHGDVISDHLEDDIRTALTDVTHHLDATHIDYDALEKAVEVLDTHVQQVGRDLYQPDSSLQNEAVDVEHPTTDSHSGTDTPLTAADANAAAAENDPATDTDTADDAGPPAADTDDDAPADTNRDET